MELTYTKQPVVILRHATLCARADQKQTLVLYIPSTTSGVSGSVRTTGRSGHLPGLNRWDIDVYSDQSVEEINKVLKSFYNEEYLAYANRDKAEPLFGNKSVRIHQGNPPVIVHQNGHHMTLSPDPLLGNPPLEEPEFPKAVRIVFEKVVFDFIATAPNANSVRNFLTREEFQEQTYMPVYKPEITAGYFETGLEYTGPAKLVSYVPRPGMTVVKNLQSVKYVYLDGSDVTDFPDLSTDAEGSRYWQHSDKYPDENIRIAVHMLDLTRLTRPYIQHTPGVVLNTGTTPVKFGGDGVEWCCVYVSEKGVEANLDDATIKLVNYLWDCDLPSVLEHTHHKNLLVKNVVRYRLKGS